MKIIEFEDRYPEVSRDVTATPYPKLHHGDSSFSLRIECDGKIIAYSSDTEWTDTLCEVARNADLFIAEAYFYEKKIRGHMDYLTLMSNYAKTRAKRLMLIHMSSNMLAMLEKIQSEYAEDGKIVKV